MNIDTATVRRLRDALVAGGVVPAVAPTRSSPSAMSGRDQASLARVVPFAETMYLMMMADGGADVAELAAIRGAIKLLTNDALDDDTVTQLIQRCESNVAEQGIEQRLQAIGARISADRLDRETAFTLAAAVALADQSIDEAELELVRSIAEWYGISGKRTQQLLEAL